MEVKAAASRGTPTVWTIGHSTRTLDDFLALLAAHELSAIADVRRFPASRRHPHFGRDALEPVLAGRGIAYRWLPELGGRRAARPDSPHVAWRDAGFRGYADHMESAEFGKGLAELWTLAAERRTAVLCAEAVPWRCHRQLLADALVVRGATVVHVLGPSSARAHTLHSSARIVGPAGGERLVYDDDTGQLALRPRGRGSGGRREVDDP